MLFFHPSTMMRGHYISIPLLALQFLTISPLCQQKCLIFPPIFLNDS